MADRIQQFLQMDREFVGEMISNALNEALAIRLRNNSTTRTAVFSTTLKNGKIISRRIGPMTTTTIPLEAERHEGRKLKVPPIIHGDDELFTGDYPTVSMMARFD